VAKVWRFTLTGHSALSGEDFQLGYHVQTNMSIGDDEFPATKVLSEIKQHFSATGENLEKFRAITANAITYTRAAVREEVQPGSGNVPGQAADTINLAGTRGTFTGDRLPEEMAAWIKMSSGFSARYARGGTHLMPQLDPSELDSNGRWANVGAAAYLDLAALFHDNMENVGGWGLGQSDIINVIYSRTRRARGQDPYTFEILHASVDTKPRWVRSRSA
jgi:hypothetical protein